MICPQGYVPTIQAIADAVDRQDYARARELVGQWYGRMFQLTESMRRKAP